MPLFNQSTFSFLSSKEKTSKFTRGLNNLVNCIYIPDETSENRMEDEMSFRHLHYHLWSTPCTLNRYKHVYSMFPWLLPIFSSTNCIGPESWFCDKELNMIRYRLEKEIQPNKGISCKQLVNDYILKALKSVFKV